jgi:lantibiotic transport system permease protein
MNFLYCFQSEWLKKRRSLSSSLVIIGAFFTPTIVLIARLVRHGRLYSESTSADFWESLWSSSWESMAIFLLPLGIILATSLVTQIEFKNNTWKQLHTAPQTLTSIFFAKLAVITVMLVQFLLLFNLGIYLSGVIPCLLTRGVPYPKESVPYLFFLNENLRYFADCLPILALEFLVSLQFSNFLVPVGGGVVLWILSLSVLNWHYGYLFPYAYCGLHYLKSLGKYTQNTHIHSMAIGYFILFTAASYILYVAKRQKG